MQRFSFSEVFDVQADGFIEPKRRIRVSGAEFGPGVKIGPGNSFGGVDFHQYKNLDIAAQEDGNVLVIRGFFRG